MKLLFYAPYLETDAKTGYSSHAIQFTRALSKSPEIDLYCLPIQFQLALQRYSQGDAQDPLIQKTFETTGLNPDIALKLAVPQNLSCHTFHGKKRIFYTVFETTKLAPTWAENLNIMDQVWTPSSWGKEAFINSGVKEELIRVVPEGVDRSIFNPYVSPLKYIKERKTFKFLCLGKWEPRKGQDILLHAFKEEFKGDKSVELLLQAQNIFLPDFSINVELQNLGFAREELKNVRFLRGFLPFGDLGKLYKSADCFVLPTRGEGWGLPIMEAMSCGLPVIATGCTGQLDFMTSENSYMLKHKGLVHAKDPRWQQFFADSQWYEPDIEHLKESMRDVYENPEKAKKVGEKASQDVKKWSWESAASKALKCFNELF